MGVRTFHHLSKVPEAGDPSNTILESLATLNLVAMAGESLRKKARRKSSTWQPPRLHGAIGCVPDALATESPWEVAG